MAIKITDHFNLQEFHSKDGTPYPEKWINSRLLKLCNQLEVVREVVKAPLIILSGYRSLKHNARVGGAKNSQHVQGTAVDVMVKGLDAKKLSAIFEDLIAKKLILDGGLGSYSNWVHYDIRKVPARWKK